MGGNAAMKPHAAHEVLVVDPDDDVRASLVLYLRLHGARVAASARVGERTLSMGSRRVRGRTARFAATFPASGRYALRLSVKPKARGAKARALSLRWRVPKAGHYEVRVRVAAGRAPRLRALGVPSAG